MTTIKREIEEIVDAKIKKYDEKLSEFFVHIFPDKFVIDPNTFSPKNIPSVLFWYYDFGLRVALDQRITEAKILLEKNGYVISK